jgi:hypothetical protein
MLKKEAGTVSEALKSLGAKDEVIRTWRELVAHVLVEPEDDGEFFG